MKKPPRSAFNHLLHSVRFRLTLWFVAILALVLVVFSVLVYTRQIRALHNDVSTRLAVQSTQVVGYYQLLLQREFEAEHNDERLPDLPQDNLSLLQPQDVLALIDGNGGVLQTTRSARPEDLAALLAAWSQTGAIGNTQEARFTPANQSNTAPHDYLFLLTPLAFGEHSAGFFLLGSPLDSTGQLPRLALTLIFSSIFILLAAFGGGYWLADRAIRPVQVITHTAREIGEGDLSRRLNLKSDDELGELANTFDEMLERLQAAFNRQRQFVADASHELRTPLTIIELETNRALDHRRSEEEYTRAMHVIQSENEWMTRLVNELLTLERVDAGQAALRMESVDLSDLAVEVIERLAPLGAKNLVQLSAGTLNEVTIHGNRGYLAQMLSNLVENAIKYSRGEQSCVQIDTGPQVRSGREGGWVRVSDNGPGIPADHLPHLFDRFYRIDQARTREEDAESTASGSGLGLAIVHSIIQAYGGTIEVKSESGQGTVFTVWLPS